MLYLTGSRALNYWYPEREIKSDTDWDLYDDDDILFSDRKNLVDATPEGLNSLEVVKFYSSPEWFINTPIGYARVVGPIGLMLFKRSHLHRPLSFQKHIRDYHFLKGMYFEACDQPEYKYFLDRRTLLTKSKYGDKTPNLNKTKDEFFDDNVRKVYDHDSLHYATCWGERPVYEELKTNNEKVWCSKKKWDCISHQKRIQCVQEEAFAISIERYMIPNRNYSARIAYSKAVERICTTLTGGWFRDFAIENWPEVANWSNVDGFYQKFLNWEKSNACV